MINEKNIEKINLILKNAKVNLNLAYINLNYKSKEIELINNEKLVNIINKIKIIENNLDNFLNFINHEKEELKKVEIKNNELMIDLINNTEKVLANTQLDTTNSIEVEKTNVNLNTVSSTEFISKSVIKTDANVAGIKQVVTKVISTISSIFKKVTGAEAKSYVTSNQPTKTNNSSFLRNINGSLNQISNSLVSNIAKIIKVDESIVDNLVQKINTYITTNNNINSFNIKNLKQLKEIMDARNISERAFFKKLEEINGEGFYGNSQEFFDVLLNHNIFEAINDNRFYGNNQKYLETSLNYNIHEIIRLTDILHDRYNMSYSDSYKTLKYMNSIGLCSYSSLADDLSSTFATNPVGFAKKFGFNLYIEDINGNVRLNTGELLLHPFILYNLDNTTIDRYGDGTLTYTAPIFYYNENNNLIFNDRALEYSYTYDDKGIKINDKPQRLGGQIYVSPNNKYSNILESQEDLGWSYYSSANITYLKKLIEEKINNGELLNIGIQGSDTLDSNGNYVSSWKLVNTSTGVSPRVSTLGHRAKVTGYEQDGIIVSTQGVEYKLLYDDIINGHPNIGLITRKIPQSIGSFHVYFFNK